MGFSLTASFAIIGVSLLISIEILTGGIIPTIVDTDESYNDMVDRTIEMVQTDINISSVAIYVNGLNYDHNISVKNTGSITLNTSDFTILINGVSQMFRCADAYLYPEQHTTFNVTNLPGDGNKRLKIITGNGIADYFEYVI